MERHGRDSYFVVGEGLIGETRGRKLAALMDAAAVPQFHFSRMGPKGTGRQLGEPNRGKIAAEGTMDDLRRETATESTSLEELFLKLTGGLGVHQLDTVFES